MKNKNSAATVAGVVASEPKKYDCCGEAFYEFDLCVKRLSGAEDLIPVNMPAILRDELKRGDKLCLTRTRRPFRFRRQFPRPERRPFFLRRARYSALFP